MGEKAKHPLVVVAAMTVAIGILAGLFAPTKAEFADSQERITRLESNQFTVQDRERLVRLESGLEEIKVQLARIRK